MMPVDDILDRAAVDLGRGREDEAVAQQRGRERLHIVGDDEVAPIDGGAGAGGTGEHRAGARRGAAFQIRDVARRADQLQDIVDHLVDQPDLGARRRVRR